MVLLKKKLLSDFGSSISFFGMLRCSLAIRRGCRVVEGTCSKLRQHYMQHHWERYEKTLSDPLYIASLEKKNKDHPPDMHRKVNLTGK